MATFIRVLTSVSLVLGMVPGGPVYADASRPADLMALRIRQSTDAADLVKALGFTADVQHEIENTLEARGWLHLPMPEAVVEKEKLRLTRDDMTMVMDFSSADQGRFLLNSRELRIDKGASFKSVLGQMERMMYAKPKTASLWQLALPSAQAIEPVTVIILVGGSLVLAGIATAGFKSVYNKWKGGDADAVIAHVEGAGQGAKIIELSCVNGHVKDFSYKIPSSSSDVNSVSYSFSYKGDKLDNVVHEGPGYKCKHFVLKGKVYSSDNADDGVTSSSFCDAKAKQQVSMETLDSRMPFEKIESCCSPDQKTCPEKIKAHVAGIPFVQGRLREEPGTK